MEKTPGDTKCAMKLNERDKKFIKESLSSL